jgi:hypothetical protein
VAARLEDIPEPRWCPHRARGGDQEGLAGFPGRTAGDPLGQHLSMPGFGGKLGICAIRTEGSGLTRLVSGIEAGFPSWKPKVAPD